ncbi:small VCP/p97-interacting protein isoform X1 [Aphelocoma coerulescens]|uniref:small VCP/p97-interacting protein isoform X1 n=1 Tax=Aphelocoma coerulescens TaxID=39617 RepID=UPI0036048FDA
MEARPRGCCSAPGDSGCAGKRKPRPGVRGNPWAEATRGTPQLGAWRSRTSCCFAARVGTSVEIKRRQLAEAAEKRQMEASSRGIKNAYAVEQKKKKQEEIEKRIAASRPGGEGGLRWQVG